MTVTNGKPKHTVYDVIVVGGGHNGLACAAYLAKAGKRVLVLERRHVLGGAAVSEEIHPGFTYSACSYIVSLLRPWIVRELALPRHGLEILPLESTFTPFPDGRSLARWSDPQRTRNEIAAFSRRDADVYPEFGLLMSRLAHFIKPTIDAPAPDPTSLSPRELGVLRRLGLGFRSLDHELRELALRLMTMSAADFLDLFFESEHLKAPMSASGIIGTFLGVRSPGTAYVLLHHYMGEIDASYRAWGFVKGGMGRISLALAGAARASGAEILTQAPVASIRVRGGRVRGVALSNGDEIEARAVVSALDPHRTFLNLIEPAHLDSEFLSRIRRFKLRGSSGKVNLALDRFPEFTCRPGVGAHLRGDVSIAPDIAYLERAYDDAKYGEYSRRPFLNIVFPSLVDPTVAPPGKHVMSIFVQYAPYHLAEGPSRWPEKREAFGDAVIATLAEYCPTLPGDILHRHVLTPWDLEQEYGLTEGNIFHGELGLDQMLFLRPTAGWSRYRTPLGSLWMCASGTHPGGGVMGASGALAARALLRSGDA